MPAVPGFDPHLIAPLFANRDWDGTYVNFVVHIPPFDPFPIDGTDFGLCGGMAFLTRDIFEAGTEQLRNTHTNRIPPELARYLLWRLVQSFDGGPVIRRWLDLTMLPAFDIPPIDGAFHQSVNDCAAITADVDNGILCPIGVVTAQSALPTDVFTGHVELVWRYERAGDILTLFAYDCNYPDEDITITIDVSDPHAAQPIITNGTPKATGRIHAFFLVPYAYADPSLAYVDAAVVTVVKLPPAEMAAGQQAMVSLLVRNEGSTTWSAPKGYRLGSRSPSDNTTWGPNRLEVGALPPEHETEVTFQITAPTQKGHYDFTWGMLREGVSGFGQPTRVLRVSVGLGQRATVPDVTEYTRDAGLAAIHRAGLTARVTGLNETNSYVITQDPPAHSLVDPGSEVHIHLRKGPPP